MISRKNQGAAAEGERGRASHHLPSRRALLAVAAALLVVPRAIAAGPAAAPLTPEQRQTIDRVQAYLNTIRTVEARFQQVAEDGSVATGTIYLERPGHMRIVYDPPVPILIVATDQQVYYYDSKLEQISRTTLDHTPAWFLLRDKIALTGDVTITGFQDAADTLRISIVETGNPDLGQVTLVLSDRPLQLRQWTVLDAQKKKVTVTLANAQFNVALNPNLFYWTDPRPYQ